MNEEINCFEVAEEIFSSVEWEFEKKKMKLRAKDENSIRAAILSAVSVAIAKRKHKATKN